MAGFVPFPSGTMNVLVRALYNSIPVELTFGIQKAGGAVALPADGGVVAGVFQTWLTAHLATRQVSSLVYNQIVVNDLTSSSGWQWTQASSTVGSIGTAGVAAQVAMTATFQTAARGRSYRGRNYVPALPAVDLASPQTWLTAEVNNLEADYIALGSAIAAAGFSHGGFGPVN